jgi:hypothetical protein
VCRSAALDAAQERFVLQRCRKIEQGALQQPVTEGALKEAQEGGWWCAASTTTTLQGHGDLGLGGAHAEPARRERGHVWSCCLQG